jgi:hypothetical protein
VKSALSLTLIVFLAGPAVLLAAQEEIRTEPGSLARSIEREVSRLAADSTPQGLEAVQQRGNPGKSDWSRVRQLVARTEIVVTVRGSQPAKRIFVSADESELTVVAPNDPALRDVVISRAAIAEIRSAVVRHPARKGALIGLGIGAAVGIAAMLSVCSGSDGEEGVCGLPVSIIGGFAGAGAGVGAGVGALVHLVTPDVIYRAP